MSVGNFMPVVFPCVHCEWQRGFSSLPVRAVLWEECLELNFAPLTARLKLKFTAEARAADIHSKVRIDFALQLLSISFPESHPQEETPFALEGMMLIARSDLNQKLRWAVFAVSTHGSFVEIFESDFRQAARVTFGESGFDISYELEDDSRMLRFFDVGNERMTDVILSWKEYVLQIVRDEIDYEELSTSLSEADVLFLIYDRTKSYLLLFFEDCFDELISRSAIPAVSEHLVLAHSKNRKILLVAGVPGSVATYRDRMGKTYEVVLPHEQEEACEVGVE